MALAHKTPAYYHDTNDIRDQGAWMQGLDDNVLLRDLSLPGTHKTMSRFGGAAPANVICQTLTLDQQLTAGIRVLDIRCRCIGNRLTIHHGDYKFFDIPSFLGGNGNSASLSVYQQATFEDVLNSCINYLNTNPSETILMRIKQEFAAENCQGDFSSQFFNNYYIDQRFNTRFWRNEGTNNNPTLGQVRNRIVILRDGFSGSGTSVVGLSYPSFADIQDDYKVPTNFQLYNKWTSVKNQLIKASTAQGRTTFYMNYLSGSTLAFPYFVASGHSDPRTDAPNLWDGSFTGIQGADFQPDFPRGIFGAINYEGTNVLAYNWIQNNQPCFCGIIMADFPGDGLIDEIILRNFRGAENGC